MAMLLLLFFCTRSLHGQGNSISFSPNEPLCIGEQIEMVCYIIPPPSTTFVLDTALVSFNGSYPAASLANINNNALIGGIDLTRYSANTDGLGVTTSRPGIRLIIASYIPYDSNTVNGCHGLFSNASVSEALVSGMPMGQANPPLPPALTVSLTSLDPASCFGSVSIAWTPGDSDRSVDTYFVFLNGDLISTLSSSINTYSHNINKILDTNYTYSITANSCAGNSTQSNQDTIYVERTSFINSAPSSVFLSYVESNGMLSVDWGLTPISRDLIISYSLQLNYTHSQYDTISNFSLSTSFSLLSNISITMVSLTPNNFATLDGVVTNITACISITSQCGATFYGETVYGFYNSENPPTTTQPTTPTINEITNTTTIFTPQPTQTLPIDTTIDSSTVIIIVLILIIIIISLIFLSIILMMSICMFIMYRKNKHQHSLPKQVPTHPYEYIDLNTLSPDRPAIKSVPIDSTYYTTMKPVDNMASTNPIHLYANLK